VSSTKTKTITTNEKSIFITLGDGCWITIAIHNPNFNLKTFDMKELKEVIENHFEALQVRVFNQDIIIFEKFGSANIKCVPIADLENSYLVTKTAQGKTIEKYGRKNAAQICEILAKVFP